MRTSATDHRARRVTRGVLATGAIAAVGSLLLAGCSDAGTATESRQEAAAPAASQPVAEAAAESSAVETPDAVATASPSAPGDVVDALGDPAPSGPFLQLGGVAVAKEIPSADVVSNVKGMSVDELNVTRIIEPVRGAGTVDSMAIYRIEPTDGPLMDAYAKRLAKDDATALCLSGANGSSSCVVGGPGGSFASPIQIQGPGEYTFGTKSIESSGPVSKKNSLGSLTFTPPAEAEFQDATCTLTGGEATRQGGDYTVTLTHSGDCAADQAFLSAIVIAGKGAEKDPFGNVHVVYQAEEASHTNDETIVTFSTEEEKLTSWDGATIKPTSIWLTVRSTSPDIAPSQVSIPLAR